MYSSFFNWIRSRERAMRSRHWRAGALCILMWSAACAYDTQYRGNDASVEASLEKGPSCPRGAGHLLSGASYDCETCAVVMHCVADVHNEPCTLTACSSTYYECFCQCDLSDARCHDACVASASESCRSCITTAAKCAVANCPSCVPGTGEWILDAGK